MFRLSFAFFAVAMLIAAIAQAAEPAPAPETAPVSPAAPTLEGAPQYHLTPGAAQTPEITAAIKAADAALFAAVFDRCDVDAVAAMTTDDFRFVHDKDGESSRAQFLESERGHCARLKTGEDFPARRELIESTLEVWPLNNYGALEIGTHRFFARLQGKPEQETETGNFMILWKKVGDKWLMAESVSYGHRLKD